MTTETQQLKAKNPNSLGKKLLVEQCQKIVANDLLRLSSKTLKKALLEAKIETTGHDIGLIAGNTGFGGLRYWLKCPKCSRRVGIVYKHPLTNELGCRVCLNLEYRKRRYKGMIESG